MSLIQLAGVSLSSLSSVSLSSVSGASSLFGPVPGGMEMMVILLVAVLLFGANKLPKLARSTGQAMGEFKKGRQDVESEIQEAAESVERETDLSEDERANV